MIGLTIDTPRSRNSRSFASWVAPRMFELVEYALSALIRYSRPAPSEVGGHLGPAAQLVDEILVQPRLVDPKLRVDEQPVAVEPLDVVALVRAAVAPDVDVVLPHRRDEHRPGDRAAKRRRVEVQLARGRDMEGAGLQGGDPLGDRLRPALDQAGALGSVGQRLARDRVVVVLVGLAEVGRVGVGDRAVLAHPVQGGAGVEPSGERDADPLADGKMLEDVRHGLVLRHGSGGWSTGRRPVVPAHPGCPSGYRAPPSPARPACRVRRNVSEEKTIDDATDTQASRRRGSGPRWRPALAQARSDPHLARDKEILAPAARIPRAGSPAPGPPACRPRT